jgi:predicted nucleic acid-binding protein
VYTECLSASGKPGAAAIARAVDDRWLTVRALSKPMPRDLPVGIGLGEREAIALALELVCPVLVDDKLARAAAQSAGLSVIGTGGLLLAAKSRSLIPSVGSELEELQSKPAIGSLADAGRRRRSPRKIAQVLLTFADSLMVHTGVGRSTSLSRLP